MEEERIIKLTKADHDLLIEMVGPAFIKKMNKVKKGDPVIAQAMKFVRKWELLEIAPSPSIINGEKNG